MSLSSLRFRMLIITLAVQAVVDFHNLNHFCELSAKPTLSLTMKHDEEDAEEQAEATSCRNAYDKGQAELLLLLFLIHRNTLRDFIFLWLFKGSEALETI